MCGKTGSLIGLEHAISPAILLRQIEVWLDDAIRVVDVLVLGIGGNGALRRRAGSNLIGAIEFAIRIGGDEGIVPMINVVTVGERYRRERDFLTLGVDSEGADIDARLKVGIASEQIVDGTVLLHDKDDVLEGNILGEYESGYQKKSESEKSLADQSDRSSPRKN